MQVYPNEYDLILRPDVNTRAHTQWYVPPDAVVIRLKNPYVRLGLSLLHPPAR
jgi:hypothetical protein